MFVSPAGAWKCVALVLAAVFAVSAAAGGDAERGKTLTAVCTACHGQDGNSIAGAFPSIAGQSERYMYKQMVDMKTGARDPGAMIGMVDALPDQDLRDLAAWYATQSPKGGAASADLVELGESIYLSGVQRKKIAACSSCHSPSGMGNDPALFPSLRGQGPEYTTAQLKAFRSKKRTNDGDSRMMRDVAMDLSDEEIDAVASYLYGLR